jgi:hypothetical protein
MLSADKIMLSDNTLYDNMHSVDNMVIHRQTLDRTNPGHDIADNILSANKMLSDNMLSADKIMLSI